MPGTDTRPFIIVVRTADDGRDPYVFAQHGTRANTPPGYTAPNGCRFAYEALAEAAGWHQARHLLLDHRGVVGVDAHRDHDCLRCWFGDLTSL